MIPLSWAVRPSSRQQEIEFPADAVFSDCAVPAEQPLELEAHECANEAVAIDAAFLGFAPLFFCPAARASSSSRFGFHFEDKKRLR